MRNLSDDGALLRVDSVIGIPPQFTLVIPGEVQREARIVRKSATDAGMDIGIEFLSLS